MEDKIYEYVENVLLEKGKIYMPTEEKLDSDRKIQILNQENVNTYADSFQKTKLEKAYDEMTTEEKLAFLQEEREKIIIQSTSQVINHLH